MSEQTPQASVREKLVTQLAQPKYQWRRRCGDHTHSEPGCLEAYGVEHACRDWCEACLVNALALPAPPAPQGWQPKTCATCRHNTTIQTCMANVRRPLLAMATEPQFGCNRYQPKDVTP